MGTSERMTKGLIFINDDNSRTVTLFLTLGKPAVINNNDIHIMPNMANRGLNKGPTPTVSELLDSWHCVGLTEDNSQILTSKKNCYVTVKNFAFLPTELTDGSLIWMTSYYVKTQLVSSNNPEIKDTIKVVSKYR